MSAGSLTCNMGKSGTIFCTSVRRTHVRRAICFPIQPFCTQRGSKLSRIARAKWAHSHQNRVHSRSQKTRENASKSRASKLCALNAHNFDARTGALNARGGSDTPDGTTFNEGD